MIRLFVFLMLAPVLMLPVPGLAQGGDPCPPAGEDSFLEGLLFGYDPFDDLPITASGPIIIERADPEAQPGDRCLIETRIVDMQLTGIKDPEGQREDTSFELDPANPSLGEILSSPGPAFPLFSFFELNLLMSIEGGPQQVPITMIVEDILEDDNLWGAQAIDDCEFYRDSTCSITHPVPPCNDVYCLYNLTPLPMMTCCQLPSGHQVMTGENVCIYALMGMPCPVPIEENTWGQIKVQYRD